MFTSFFTHHTTRAATWVKHSVSALTSIIIAVVLCVSGIAGVSTGIMPHSSRNFSSFSGSIPSAYAAEKESDSQSQQTKRKKQPLVLSQSTSIISHDSGYSATFTVTNTGNKDTNEGTLSVFANPDFTFRTSDQLRDWATAQSAIPTPSLLTNTHVPSLKAGSSTRVTISIPADAPELAAFTTWGAKPLRARWSTDDGNISEELHTFVTRTNADTDSAQLPQIKFVIAVPAGTTNSEQCTNSKNVQSQAKSFLSDILAGNNLGYTNTSENTASTDNSGALLGTLSAFTRCTTSTLTSLRDIQTANSNVSFIMDSALTPSVAATSSGNGLNVSAISQPFGEDISTLGSAKLSDEAASWSTDISASSASSSFSATPRIAWQGATGWSEEALKAAQKQGYSTVIATDHYYSTSDSAVHNSVSHIAINGSNMTVLTAQKELSTLLQGTATDSYTAETSEAGLLNRFIAQTAFYETQAPYEDRTVLITAGNSSTSLTRSAVARIANFISTLNTASWAHIVGMSDLLNASSALDDEDMHTFAQKASHFTDDEKKSISALSKIFVSAQSQRNQINSFINDVTEINVNSDANRTSSHSSEGTGRSSSAQDLAKGQADKSKQLAAFDSSQWAKQLLSLTNFYALQSLSAHSIHRYITSSSSVAPLIAQKLLVDSLYSAVKLSAPSSLHVVSESATIPVMISNDLPVPVKVGVSPQSTSSVHSEVTVAGHEANVIDAHTDQQITLSVHAISGWSTDFKLYLTTKANSRFPETSSVEKVRITSKITILDNAGYIIFVLAILLAIVGAHRQIARYKSKKDTHRNRED
ncbi:DUF6049 family protein [Alloscardovia venturai]|uniref:DUF6049 family protein n=1 Tax=Alloscardovia venturai TaxID=1769421 RepID=A0ABW2Y4W2_9BIFI